MRKRKTCTFSFCDWWKWELKSCIGFIKKCSKMGYFVVKSMEDSFILLPECLSIDTTPRLMFLLDGLCGIGTLQWNVIILHPSSLDHFSRCFTLEFLQ